jgi:hypothetical protein
MDVCFGRGDKAHGGILFRAIVSLDPPPVGEFIEGPCNSVTRIFS